jgi:predicted amidohydrolase YtcJ
MALDAIALSNQTSGPHRLTHLFLVDERDRSRFQSLNVVADFQLAPSAVDLEYATFLTDLLGQDRPKQVLPALELYQAGATLTLSSDWDADTLSPILKMWTVLNRPDSRSFPDLETVIPMLTLNPSKLLHTNTGSIEVGKQADLVALDMNIFQMNKAEINRASVVFTMFNGNVVFDPTGIAGTAVGSPAPPPSASTSRIRSSFGLVLSGIGAILLCFL